MFNKYNDIYSLIGIHKFNNLIYLVYAKIKTDMPFK